MILQTLMRQLTETKDSLVFSNHLCEQLELKVEEMERANKELSKLCEGRQTLLDQKTSDLALMEEDLAQNREERSKIQEELAKMRKELAAASGRDDIDGPIGGRKISDKVSQGKKGGKDEEEEAEMKEINKELSLKLQNMAFQKKRLEREMEEVLNENLCLSRSLEKMEAELVDVQSKYEEERSRSRNSDILSLTSPPGHVSSVVSSLPSTPAVPLSASTIKSSNSHQHFTDSHNKFVMAESSSSSQPAEGSNGQSLFSELDNEYSTLQERYGELLHRCTCSASLLHKTTHNHSDETGEVPPPRTGSSGAFKDLFDEMFATLRQTAQVADKLIDRKLSS